MTSQSSAFQPNPTVVGKIKQLSDINLDKIYLTVLDISYALEMANGNVVSIKAMFGHFSDQFKGWNALNSAVHQEYRSEALNKLEHWGVIEGHTDGQEVIKTFNELNENEPRFRIKVNVEQLQSLRSLLESIRNDRKLTAPSGPLFPPNGETTDSTVAKPITPPQRDPKREFDLEVAMKRFALLNQLTKEKIWITLHDLDDALQLEPSAHYVEIPLFFRRTTKLFPEIVTTATYRKHALDFLSTMNIARMYKVEEGNRGSRALVYLDLKAFQSFKAEIEKIYAPDANEEMPTDKNALTVENERMDSVYTLRLTESREVLINDFVFTRLNFASDNEITFSHIWQNPNKTVSSDDMEKKPGKRPPKDFHRLLNQLGFTGDLRRAFFDVSKDSIRLHNPVTRNRLAGLGIAFLRLPPEKPAS